MSDRQTAALDTWLSKLGYADEDRVLHRRGEPIPEAHPYAREIQTLLSPDGAIRAKAVFDVEGVPTVVFVGDNEQPLSPRELDEARKRIWNQNLATVVIEVKGETAQALPARKLANAGEELDLAHARPDGPFSAFDFTSANVSRREPDWFDAKARVDRRLLRNLLIVASQLSESGFDVALEGIAHQQLAQQLVGQVLFISYLEHRRIVGETYRLKREVGELHVLVREADRRGVELLIDALRADFNGDFLADDRHQPWRALTTEGFALLDQFLRRTDMQTGQGDFWNYDFSYIPVELLSGIYETFLPSKQQAAEGAYYTPRNLAMLAVDQAFSTSPDPLSETIFDGACGSGILLTTAYRRLISLSEIRSGRQLSFSERAELLKRHIFGADINFMACRVTAFSLYLSLLEGLDPADISVAQEVEGTKLPSLSGVNLAHGSETADFFTERHAFWGKRFSLLISNPPWVEPEGDAHTSADAWAERARAPHVRRQIAGAFTLRALDFLKEGGRVCFILPIPQFLAPTSSAFVAELFRGFRPVRLINFGDLQGLLFQTAELTCHVFIAERRPEAHSGRIPVGEAFEYWVPKADLSLALGRLTMQSSDRHRVLTMSVTDDPRLLVTLMWGDANDLAILRRLSVRGTFADFWKGPPKSRRWVLRKGIHLRDRSREAVDAGVLRQMKFLDVAALKAGSPILHPDLLRPWPEQETTVVGLGADVLRVFNGPRILFPDGFSNVERNIRAVYFDGPAAFTHSVGVIAGDSNDAGLLKFAAVFLRSTLGRYLLMMLVWKMLSDRNGFHLADLACFPFFPPESAPNPDVARNALKKVAECVNTIARASEPHQHLAFNALLPVINHEVFAYFGLSFDEQVLIEETVSVLLPSVRPRSLESLDTPAQKAAQLSDLARYAHTLGAALTSWRTRMGGKGSFQVGVVTSDPNRAGPSGIVRVGYDEGATGDANSSSEINDETVLATLGALRDAGLRVLPSGSTVDLMPDAQIMIGSALYLVRPLTRRSWTVRQALRDAENIVRSVQARGRVSTPMEVA
jgi:hypothetical protein